jgi:mannose-1-phosphate guanylyltransferase/mannose-6-phosphate isomerase
MLQDTVMRLESRVPPERMIFITSEELVDSLKDQVHKYMGYRADKCTYVGEPSARNTAAAILLGAHLVHSRDPEGIMICSPADHLIMDTCAFSDAIDDSLEAAVKGKLITYGIRPTRPETGYGYIRSGADFGKVLLVDKFVEKPPIEKAREYIEDRSFLWNSGIFMFGAAAVLGEGRTFLPDTVDAIVQVDPETLEGLAGAYEKVESISIDHGIMERTGQAAVKPVSMGWSDVGSWDSLYEMGEKDLVGNVQLGNVLQLESTGNYLSAGNRLLAVSGVDDLIIVQTEDATLVCPRGRSQDVKHIVDQLKADGRAELDIHATVRRPWGTYTVLETGPGYKIKKIVVDPGAKLSLQLHRKRSEHWVVVTGEARVTRGEETLTVATNESTFIPVGTRHRLANSGNKPLEIIEVQSGEYVGEDDIERFDDEYGRIK